MSDLPLSAQRAAAEADPVAPPAPSPAAKAATGEGALTRPLTRLIFWVASLGALAAAAVAIFAGAGAGWNGVILLSGIASVALLLMYALAAGETAGRSLLEGGERKRASGAAATAMGLWPDPVLITDAQGRVAWANPAYVKLADTLIGVKDGGTPAAPERLFSGAGAGAVYRLNRAASAGETAREVVGRIPLGGGESVVYSADVSALEDGATLWRFSELRDDASLDADEAPDWTDHAPVGLFSADAEGRVLAANATLRSWIGVSEDAALKLQDITTGDTAQAFAQSRGADGVIRLDARLKQVDGEESPVVICVSWSDERPAKARAVGYELSATGAPPAVAAVEPREASSGASSLAGGSFDEMFATAPFGVARLDDADPALAVIEDANPALLKLSGGGAVPGAKFEDLFDFGDDGRIDNVLGSALAGRGEPSEVRLKAGEDGERAVQVFLSPSRDGKRVAYVVDVSSWKALEQQVAQAGKMQAVGQLASGVAHDFNNMLTAIRLNVGELLNRHPVGDPSYQDLQQINSTVTRQAGLVRKLLAFSRKQTFRNTVFDVSDVLSDCSIMLGQILEETVRLDIKHGRDLPLVRADRNQIDNILVNLATNARDAMKSQGGGVLTIVTEAVSSDDVARAGAPNPKDGDWAAIHVSDTGTGMDEATLKKIFEPFFTTKEAGQGTGLGLATVYGVVKQSGGFLFVDSEVGKGTTFHIYLPGHVPSEEEETELAREEAAKTAEPEPSDLAGRGRILFVEDEDAVRAIAAKTLVRRGYEVVEACDGEEALEILENEPESFDLLISDVVMPGLDGPGLLKEARHLLGSARIVFISGYAKEEFSDTLSDDLEISFLPKPFDIQQLAERVKQELAARQRA